LDTKILAMAALVGVLALLTWVMAARAKTRKAAEAAALRRPIQPR
jgi:hypothetical protein